MDLTTKESVIMKFESIIKKSPPIFDEILVKLAPEHDLPEKDIIILKNDLLFTVLVVIMMENGFRCKVEDGKLLEDVGNIDSRRLDNWKSQSGMYDVEFMLGSCEVPTKLMLIPLASAVLVNVVIKGKKSETYSVCLQVDQYIELTMRETTVAKLFRNLQQLSDTFKNKVVTPVKSNLLSLCGYPGASLLGLPEDIFLKLMLYLPVTDILRMYETCRRFKTLVDDDNLWHKLFIRDYSLLPKLEACNQWYRLPVENNKALDPNKYENWKEVYKKYYLDRPSIKPVPSMNMFISRLA